jgi:hypothetical protein
MKNAPIVTPASGKRNRDVLSANQRDIRYQSTSQSGYFLNSRSLEDSVSKAVRSHYRAKTHRVGVSESRINAPILYGDFASPEETENEARYPGFLNERRISIKYLYSTV